MLRSWGAEGDAWSCTRLGRQLSELISYSITRPDGADGVSRGDGVAAAALAALLLRVIKVYYRNSWLKLTLGC
jgi:hypothetical protein